MKKITVFSVVLALVSLVSLWITGCTEEKIIDIVLSASSCAPFEQDSESEVFTDTVLVDLGAEVDSALADAGYSRSIITGAVLNGATYQVTDFSHTHDWTITGEVLVQRLDITSTEKTLLVYAEQSLLGAMPNPVIAALTADGVALINQALDDFVDGANPVIRIVVVNGSVKEEVSSDDPIVFNWEACLDYQIVVEETVEVVDPL